MFRPWRFLQSLIVIGLCTIASLAGAPSAAQKEDVKRLRWKDHRIRIDISSSLTEPNPNIKVGSDVAGAIQRSLAAWNQVAALDIFSHPSEKQSVSPAGAVGDGVSLITIAATPGNILFFGSEPDDSPAKTRIFYNRLGLITEADIVLNPFLLYSTDGSYATVDLESTLRHEIGHLLGLLHSEVIGSAMYDSASRNGVFGSLEKVRPLSNDDISNVRSIYGTAGDNDECCGTIVGKVLLSSRRSASVSIWVEESGSGRTFAYASTDRNRGFKIGGLPEGNYTIFAREESLKGRSYSQRLGEVTVIKGESVSFAGRYVRQTADFALQFLGINGILSDSPIVLQRGATYSLLAGGKNVSGKRLRIGVDSPYISVESTPDPIADIDYADGISAFPFQVSIDPEAPSGDYDIYGISSDGGRDYRIGGLTIGPR